MVKKTSTDANGMLLLKKWWFWLIFVTAVGMMAGFGGGTDTAKTNASDDAVETAIANFEEMAAEASEEQAEANKRAEAVIQAVDDKEDAIIFLAYESDTIESGFSENVLIKFYGTAAGTISYDSTLGETITVPAAFVTMLDLQ